MVEKEQQNTQRIKLLYQGNLLCSLAFTRHYQTEPAFHNEDGLVQRKLVDQWRKSVGNRMDDMSIDEDTVASRSLLVSYSTKKYVPKVSRFLVLLLMC